ncbi:hypothetical protein ACQ0P8_03150 [Halodesulfovibrio aestuarii]|uniref:Cache domain-containing protein n=1 Tax=Halodesulfovibrio aestuarii TaxID=126333 RepID=A0A8G2C7Q1_9BACT|nr:hypothetical protein [Halodesulfovibrio aestuarii]SHI68323.1 hypothetical protein SAMN05660830_00658 [Halodesulfovibrio aestuarii]
MHYSLRCGVALCALLVLLTGCKQSVNNTWRETKGYYNTYLNTPAELEFAEVDVEAAEDNLAAMYTPIGEELEKFVRVIDAKDVFPDLAWVDATMKRFPWLSGIAVVNLEGNVLMQRPSVSMKPLNFAPLLDENKDYGFRALRGYVDETPLGNEAYVAMPFFVDNEMKGLVVAHFDARNLVELSPNPEELVVLSGKKMLWSGKYNFESTPFAQINWEEMLSEESHGVFEESGNSYTWLVRYVGNIPMIFGTAIVEASAS